MFLLLNMCVAGSLFAQKEIDPVITGKVSNESGEALQGVSIAEKGTENTVVSNPNGEFTIRLEGPSRTLIFSSVGFVTQTIKLGNRHQLMVVMNRSTSSLDEVVVIGYGKSKKIDLTGAVASISASDIGDRPVSNISQALQGQMANLNVLSSGGAPTAKPSLNIRGYTGFNVSAGPLIVIDGVPGGDINAINPADIDNISILKDAASSAIYGSSAPYGVMLITTKQGKKGKKPSISYSNNFSYSQVVNLPKMVNSLDFANIFNEAFVNAGRAPWFTDETIQRIKDYQDGTLKTETIKDPNHDDWYGSGIGYFTGAGPNYGNGNNDWFHIFFRDWAPSQQHNLGISGGGNSSTYYVGAGYLEKEGMYNFMADSYKRFNFRANLSSSLTKWMTVNLRSSFSRELSDNPADYRAGTGASGGNYMHQIARKLPTTPLKNPDGFYSDYSNINLFTQGGRDDYTYDKILLTGEMVLTPAKGWNITGNITYDGSNYNESNFNKVVYSVLPSGNKVVDFQTDPINSLLKNNSKMDHYIMNLYSSYEKDLGNHHFEVLGGFITNYLNTTSITASNSLLYSNDIPSLNLTYNTTPSVGDNDIRLASEGLFGRLNYNYKEKFLLEANGRYDATSRFLPGRRWNLNPSVSAGYVISKEDFWSPIKNVVNSFKLRGSYGSLGDQWGDNAAQNNYYPFYPSLVTVSPSSSNWIFGDGREAYVASPSLVNQQLTWATIKTLDFGFDAELLSGRLTASFDWYNRNAENFVGPSQALPAVLGTGVPNANNASMRTRGFELSMGWNDRIGKVNYYVRGNLSNYVSKVLKYPNPTGLLSTWYSGMTLGEIWGYQTVGLFQTADEISNAPDQSKLWAGNWTPGDVQYKDLNGDGKVDFGNNTVANPGDQKVIGNYTPQYSYGISFGANWNGFDAYVFLQGVAKRKEWMASNMYYGIQGGEWQSTVLTTNLDRWTPETPDGFFPKYYMSGEMGKNRQVQTRYLLNAAYMRIKNIQLGYNIPKAVINRIGIQNLRVYLSADNVATMSKLKHASVDPELVISDAAIYPLQRTFSFGLNVSL